MTNQIILQARQKLVYAGVTLRHNGPTTAGLIRRHFRGNWLYWLFGLAALGLAEQYVGFGAVESASVPYKVYLIKKWDRSYPKKGEWVVFKWHGGGLMPKGSRFVKQVHGVTGDQVAEIDRKFYVNGEYQGLAKQVSRKGMKLEVGPVGTIPEHYFYVFAPAPDSLDSRYKLTGWIHEGQIIGKAVPLL